MKIKIEYSFWKKDELKMRNKMLHKNKNKTFILAKRRTENEE